MYSFGLQTRLLYNTRVIVEVEGCLGSASVPGASWLL